MTKVTPLGSGQITNHDQLAVVLVEPADGTPALVQVQWPPRHTTTTAAAYPSVAAIITRLIAESAVALGRRSATKNLVATPPAGNS